jgi:predicted dehydrogenase
MSVSRTDAALYMHGTKPSPVVGPGEFVIAAAALEHSHIYGMVSSLLEAGATLKYVWDPDPEKAAAFAGSFPQVTVADSLERILDDPAVALVAAAGVPNERAALGIRVMDAGKHYFVDKTPLTTLGQLADVKTAAARTGKRYFCYFGERLCSEAGILAGYMIMDGVIGDVIQMIGTGPHRHGKSRPDWFYRREQYGGILCDIGSHQIEQFLYYTKNTDAAVISSKVGNYTYPDKPEFEDFGDATLVGANGATDYFRVDWHTPDGLRAWGDGRVFIVGTKGYMELRKYTSLAHPDEKGNQIFLVTDREETQIDANGVTGYPFFGQMILDCLNGTETAMTQAHIFKAAELCVRCQMQALHIRPHKNEAGMFCAE